MAMQGDEQQQRQQHAQEEEQEQENEFSFVGYTHARLPNDPAIRTVIRRHAMRNVAETRRRRDNYGKQSLSQPLRWTLDAGTSSPTQYSSSTELVPSSRVDAPANAIVSIKQKYLASPAPSLPMTTPEATITDNFAILQLVESLAGPHLGVDAQTSPALRLGPQKSQFPKSRTLLSFIPPRYGHVAPLTCAVDCLVARVRQITLKEEGISEDQDLQIFYLYDKALKSLQEAINDEEAGKTPETLCAAELLGFFEHVAGVAQLIQHQGVDQFQTDFELALIAAYVGPLVHEAFLNHRTCFLAKDEWKSVIRKAIGGSSSSSNNGDNSMLRLWLHLIESPNLFKKVTQIVLLSDPVPSDAIQSAERGLVADLQDIQGWLGMEYDMHNTTDIPQSSTANFLAWHSNFKQSIVSLQQQKNASWPILQGACITSWLTRARLLMALSPSRFHDLEAVGHKFSYDIKSWKTNATSLVNAGLLGGLFMWQTVASGRVHCETNAIWTEDWSLGAYGRDRKQDGMIGKEEFEAWCEAIGIDVR
ncbi:hypothetical protein V8C35DRAFT_327984 [Trichoderma chlorosporum]